MIPSDPQVLLLRPDLLRKKGVVEAIRHHRPNNPIHRRPALCPGVDLVPFLCDLRMRR